MSTKHVVDTSREVKPDLVSSKIYGHFKAYIIDHPDGQPELGPVRRWEFEAAEGAAAFIAAVEAGEFLVRPKKK